ncbi:sigma-70 family RNA polymerase sigma factor [Gemmata sp. JC717]|uniref:sigma-70 family RNA polymerase sigma factor n=1 Tax=Gemmata algarum TaxID=2975278 RepID=UPI0021BA7687|nr:sigma-70 family RNA polymerase sigma factor [Gemmata algarum]MDY3552881.1 sigma-70 family RNA polymerase sigma factor [Gemmata algarum]
MSGPGIRNYLRTVGIDPTVSGSGDAELVRRFAETGDETAFELLVWRHAPLVQRVCVAVLRDRHAAEDAAQATFLILARKAQTFTGHGAVVGWLYRVARRVSVRLARQRARQPVGTELRDVVAPAAPDTSDTGALWEEVARLPERYRVPVLLCFCEGLTHAEAARRTGLPVGTVAGRLARAKELLARRLSRRGFTLGAVALPVVAGAFVGSTARAAAELAAGRLIGSLISPTVLQLTQGAMRSMTATLFKTAAAVLAACAAAASVWALVPGGAPLPEPQTTPAVLVPVAAPAPNDAGTAADGLADARQRARSLNNLKQIMRALYSYESGYGHFPNDITDGKGKALLSWRVAILPYIDQGDLYKRFKLDEPWDSDNNKPLLGKMPDLFRVGIEEKGAVKTYYQGIAGTGTAFEAGRRIKFADVTDGTSNTLGVVEAGPPVEWTKPADISYDPRKAFPKFDGPFRNVWMAATLDGAVHTLKPDLKDQVLHDLATRAGGEVVDIEKAKAPALAYSKEDKELAVKIQKENLKLLQKRVELFQEWAKLTAEWANRAGALGPDLEKLQQQQEQLQNEVRTLVTEIENLKKELGKR